MKRRQRPSLLLVLLIGGSAQRLAEGYAYSLWVFLRSRPPTKTSPLGGMRLVTLPNFSRGRRLAEVRGRGVVSTYLVFLAVCLFLCCVVCFVKLVDFVRACCGLSDSTDLAIDRSARIGSRELQSVRLLAWSCAGDARVAGRGGRHPGLKLCPKSQLLPFRWLSYATPL